jgi:hypothetical protein
VSYGLKKVELQSVRSDKKNWDDVLGSQVKWLTRQKGSSAFENFTALSTPSKLIYQRSHITKVIKLM